MVSASRQLTQTTRAAITIDAIMVLGMDYGMLFRESCDLWQCMLGGNPSARGAKNLPSEQDFPPPFPCPWFDSTRDPPRHRIRWLANRVSSDAATTALGTLVPWLPRRSTAAPIHLTSPPLQH